MKTKSRLPLAALLIAVPAFTCTQDAINPAIPDASLPTVSMNVDAVTLIEHRGRFYRVEDLTDPAFVAQSDDPFVRGFAANRNVAVQWAGMSHANMPSAEMNQRMTIPVTSHVVPHVEYSRNSDTFSRR